MPPVFAVDKSAGLMGATLRGSKAGSDTNALVRRHLASRGLCGILLLTSPDADEHFSPFQRLRQALCLQFQDIRWLPTC